MREWPADGPPLVWKVTELGGGDSAPSVAAGRLYGMANRGEDEVAWSLSEKDGKEIWVTRLGPAFKQQASQSKEGPGCTPTVDGDLLYVEGVGGDVACLQAEDGKILWQRSLVRDFGGRVPMWSYRESPLVDGDRVIVTPGGGDAMLAALGKLTGKTIWQGKVPDTSGGNSSGGGAVGGSPGGGGAATAVTGTKDPGLFTSEHWGMRAFSARVPNGRYLAKLYFAETYTGITGSGQRVFSYNVMGQEIKDFDIWVKAGGSNRAHVESVPVEVTNGEFRIDFTPQVENPAIKAVELIPQADAASGTAPPPAPLRINAGASAPFTDSSGQCGRRIPVLMVACRTREPPVSQAARVIVTVAPGVRAALADVVGAAAAAEAGRPTRPPSPSPSKASANTCNSSPMRSWLLRRQTGSSCGAMTSRPTAWVSTAPRPLRRRQGFRRLRIWGRRRTGQAGKIPRWRRQGRGGLFHAGHAEPPWWNGSHQRLLVRCQRRKRGRRPGLPRFPDRQSHVGPAQERRWSCKGLAGRG